MKERKVRHAKDLLRHGGTHMMCSKCEEVKELTEENFYKNDNEIGFMTVCKCCKKEYYRQNREAKIEYQKQYIKEHDGYYREYRKGYLYGKGNVLGFNMKEYKKSQSRKRFLLMQQEGSIVQA